MPAHSPHLAGFARLRAAQRAGGSLSPVEQATPGAKNGGEWFALARTTTEILRASAGKFWGVGDVSSWCRGSSHSVGTHLVRMGGMHMTPESGVRPVPVAQWLAPAPVAETVSTLSISLRERVERVVISSNERGGAMSAARQKFSAQTRLSGALDKPNGMRRKNIESGRLSVVFGKDLLRVMCDDAEKAGTSAGGFARDLALAHYASKGVTPEAIADRAAELRASDPAETAESAPTGAPAAAAV